MEVGRRRSCGGFAFTISDTRFATLLILQGESLASVRDQLGHRSIQVTVDIYGHAVPGGNRAAVDRLDDVPLTAPTVTAAAPDASTVITRTR